VSSWGLLGGEGITYTPCYIRSGEKETESTAGKARQDMTLQIKWLCVAMRLLDALIYMLDITFFLISTKLRYPANPMVLQVPDITIFTVFLMRYNNTFLCSKCVVLVSMITVVSEKLTIQNRNI
jgi:hypothetical protein